MNPENFENISNLEGWGLAQVIIKNKCSLKSEFDNKRESKRQVCKKLQIIFYELLGIKIETHGLPYICTLRFVAMECTEHNWSCKYFKKVRSCQDSISKQFVLN